MSHDILYLAATSLTCNKNTDFLNFCVARYWDLAVSRDSVFIYNIEPLGPRSATFGWETLYIDTFLSMYSPRT